ncbi:MAG: SDR family NAD(P)-dependent oxidoreductase [Candidatus Omnitrophica bacterium]|nr:SDR family NAD(P)-dependent oxidoreductase [Candidatus Omnitrophota bacterium]
MADQEKSSQKGKAIIINGATRGLGLALAKIVANSPDFHVICLVRDMNHLSGLEPIKDHIDILECDYSKIEKTCGFRQFSQMGPDKYSHVYFINNVSDCLPVGRLGKLDPAEIAKSITVNISSNVIILNNFLNIILQNNVGASILNISSGIAQNPVAGLGLYGLGKAAMDYMATVLKKEAIENTVRVSTFYPGGMDTDMQSKLQSQLKASDDLKKFNYDAIYDQKISSPLSVAKIIHDNFLIGDNGWQKAISKKYDYPDS